MAELKALQDVDSSEDQESTKGYITWSTCQFGGNQSKVLYIFHCLSGYVHRTVCNANSQVMRMALSWSSGSAAVGTALRSQGTVP